MSLLKIIFYGTRGSFPISDPKFNEFGGNTTCIAFHRNSTNRISVMDAGTGLRNLGKDFSKHYPDQKNLNITFSHFHWDHIQGFPFFDPAYNPDIQLNLRIFGGDKNRTDLSDIFETQMQERYFPVSLDKMGSKINFVAEDYNCITGENAIIRSIKQNHPGGSLGFRIEVEDKVIVVCTDQEHEDTVEEKYVDFARDADILIHDAQYTDEELKTHRGWGHSSYSQCMELAERANCEKLIFTHHDPDHDDDFLSEMELSCQKRFPDSVMAREGMIVDI